MFRARSIVSGAVHGAPHNSTSGTRCGGLTGWPTRQRALPGSSSVKREATMARVSVAAGVADALEGVEFVQENGPENIDRKMTIFAELDRLAPREARLGSSTSAIVASRFTELLPGRARCLVGHPVNPPHL